LAVVRSLPSAIRLEEVIVPDSFWSFAEPCVEPVPPTNPNAILSAIATALIRLVVILSDRLFSGERERDPLCFLPRDRTGDRQCPITTGPSITGARIAFPPTRIAIRFIGLALAAASSFFRPFSLSVNHTAGDPKSSFVAFADSISALETMISDRT
jgi:hypothetical protein